MDYSSLAIHNLPPQSTPFVGRRAEINDIVSRFQDDSCRLLTLVGSGGTGKTRLAIESIPHLIKPNFEHGTFYVPLAPVSSADNIITTIINILGIQIRDNGASREALVKFLSQRNVLLVMDNFEHVINGAEIVAEILHSAPRVKILVTSREMLNLSMEHVWHVRGMRYPNSNEPDAINQYDAVNLFIERALQVQQDFSPGDEQVAIIHICRLVDGLPLAIELAAGWLKTLSCQDIIQQIEHDIDFLATRNRDIPDRHRSIRVVFDHSWDLLSAEERAAFPRLAIFRGGFTLDATEHVAKADLLTLSGLVEKSMVRRDNTGRYDIHELLRQYGEEHLHSLGDFDAINKSHLDYFAKFTEARVPDLQGRRQIDSLNEIRADFDNIRTAWQYASDQHFFDKLDSMLEPLDIFFDITRNPPIANEMYSSTLAQNDRLSDPHYQQFRHRLQIYLWFTRFRQRLFFMDEPSLRDVGTHLSIAERDQDYLIIFKCLVIMMLAPPIRQEPDTDHLLYIAQKLGQYYVGSALNQLCYYFTILRNENSERVRQCLHDYLEVTQTLNDISGVAVAYSHLAQHARFWGEIDDALTYYNLSINRFEQINSIQGLAIFRALRILMYFKQGQFQRVIEQLPYYIEQLAQFGYFTNHRYVNTVLAKAEALLGQTERSQGYVQYIQTMPVDGRIRTEFHIIEAQAMIAINLDDMDTLRQHLIDALQLDTSVIGLRLKLDFIPLVAFLYQHDSHYTTAAELLGLAFLHPLATTGWMEKWALLSQLCDTLQQALGQRVYTIAWEQGGQRDIEETLAEIRAYIGLESPPTPSRQPLVDPLTDRELEVLELLGKGYSNRGIAQELIVSVGTVKTHVHNICQKLDAKNRTQAVIKAKTLGLL